MRNPDRETSFRFRHFSMSNSLAGMKIGTDGVLLAAWALTKTSCRASDPDRKLYEPGTIVDAGTGTGVIALLMAQRFPNARIIGVEIEETAATEAEYNRKMSPWSNRIRIMQGDFVTMAGNTTNAVIGNPDLLISNPPFFTNGETSADTNRKLARHAGTLSPASLLETAGRVLRDNGRLCMVSTPDKSDEIEFKALLLGLQPERITRVATAIGKSPRRILWQFVKCNGAIPVLRDELAIRSSAGVPTDEYRALVEPYYHTVK